MTGSTKPRPKRFGVMTPAGTRFIGRMMPPPMLMRGARPKTAASPPVPAARLDRKKTP
jgi:hypothetical protein